MEKDLKKYKWLWSDSGRYLLSTAGNIIGEIIPIYSSFFTKEKTYAYRVTSASWKTDYITKGFAQKALVDEAIKKYYPGN